MKKINDYFNKFRNITNHSLVVRTTAEEILEKYFSIKIKNEALSFRTGVLKINAPGPAKSEIITQREKIIKKINDRLGGKVVVKIV